jgi:hypothetical protein
MKILNNIYLALIVNFFLCRFKITKFKILYFVYKYYSYPYTRIVYNSNNPIDFNLKKSNQFLTYYENYFVLEEHFLTLSLKNQLVQKGKKTGWCYFNSFLLFLKFQYNVTGIPILLDHFLDSISLPYKLYVVRFSNRNYYFPGPIFIDAEQLAFLRKAFNTGIKKQYDIKYINKFFIEIIAFLTQSGDSILLQILQNIIDQGMENRAFIHYRWRLHKRS